MLSGKVQESIDNNSFKSFAILQSKPIFSNARKITIAQRRLDVFNKVEGKYNIGINAAAEKIENESLRLKGLLYKKKTINKKLNEIDKTISEYTSLSNKDILSDIKETRGISDLEKMVDNAEDLYNHTYFMPNGNRRKEITKLIKHKEKEIADNINTLNKELSAAKRIQRGGIETDLKNIDSYLSSQFNPKEVDDIVERTVDLIKQENTSILGNHQKGILLDLQERLETIGNKERLDVFKRLEALKNRSNELVKTDIYVNRLEKRILELKNDADRLKKLPKTIDVDNRIKTKYEKVKEINKNLDLSIRERELLVSQRLDKFNKFLKLDKDIKGFVNKQFPKVEKEISDTVTYLNKSLGKDILKEEDNTEKALNMLFAKYLKNERLLKDMQLKEGVGDVFLINHLRDTEVLEEIAKTNFNMKANPFSFSLQRMNVLGTFTEGQTKSGSVGTSYFELRQQIFDKVKGSMAESYKPYKDGGLTKGIAGEILELTTDKPKQLLVQSRNKVKGHIENLATLKANLQWYKNQLNDYSDLISAKELNSNLSKLQNKIDKAILNLDDEYKTLNETITSYNKRYNVRHELGKGFGKDISNNSEFIQDIVSLKDVESIIKRKTSVLESYKLTTISSFSDNYVKAVQGLQNRTKYPKSIEAYEEFIGKHIATKNKVIHTPEEIEYFKRIFPNIKNVKGVNQKIGINFKDLEDISKKYSIPYTDLIAWFNNYHTVKSDDINKLILGKKLSTYKNYVNKSQDLKNLQKERTNLYQRYVNLKETIKSKYGYNFVVKFYDNGSFKYSLEDFETNPNRWRGKRPYPGVQLAEIKGIIGLDEYSLPSEKTYIGLGQKEQEILSQLNELHNQILI